MVLKVFFDPLSDGLRLESYKCLKICFQNIAQFGQLKIFSTNTIIL